MHLNLLRYACGPVSTIGVLSINGRFGCHMLENPWKNNRRRISSIPTGTYRIGLRTEGGWHARGLKKFGGQVHKGMLEIERVPGRTFILIHWGNRPKDTDGCILVGSTASEDFVGQSVKAYSVIYPQIADAVLRGDDVLIHIKDMGG